MKVCERRDSSLVARQKKVQQFCCKFSMRVRTVLLILIIFFDEVAAADDQGSFYLICIVLCKCIYLSILTRKIEIFVCK